MKRLRTPIIIVLVLGVGLLLWYSFIAAGERVTFYQTYGYKEGDSWVIPIHLRVWERGLVERGQERLIARAAESAEQLTGQSIGGLTWPDSGPASARLQPTTKAARTS
jgi:hypothetical protein